MYFMSDNVTRSHLTEPRASSETSVCWLRCLGVAVVVALLLWLPCCTTNQFEFRLSSVSRRLVGVWRGGAVLSDVCVCARARASSRVIRGQRARTAHHILCFGRCLWRSRVCVRVFERVSLMCVCV